jgi:ferredoxin-NADP reductase
MSNHHVKLKRKEEVAEGTMAFYFERPAGFQFKAGQFADFSLLNPPETDAEGNIRSFTIASAPQEEDLMFATRMRDTAFKRVLKTMPLGTEIEMEGPSGSLVLHGDSSRPAVLLAGGIGITPFRSMILGASTSRHAHRLLLLYSNRRPEDAAFLQELEAFATRNKNFTLIATMTGMTKSKLKWSGRTGSIDKQMLSESIPDLKNSICYLAGPPTMVSRIGQTLAEAGVSKDSIRAEAFDGY